MLQFVEGFVESALVAGAIANIERDDGEFGGVLEDDLQFDVAGLLQPPVVEADFVDEGLFDVVGGLEVAAVAFAHVVVLGPFFGREAEGARAEIVFAGVLAGDGFAGRGTGSGGTTLTAAVPRSGCSYKSVPFK